MKGPDTNIPLTLREAREAQRLSREGLAFKAGVSYKTIERIEAGQLPRRATAKVIADALGCEVGSIWPALVEAAA